MEITDYIIDIKDSSLQDRLRLRQVLLDNNQVIINSNPVPMHLNLVEISYSILADGTSWGTSRKQPNINIQDFISKFKVQDKLRNLVIYKRSGENWTESECKQIFEFVGENGTLPQIINSIPIYDDVQGEYYNWRDPPNSGLNIAYEDLFPQEQQMNPFKVGDRVRCIKNPNTSRILYSIWTISYVHDDQVVYTSGHHTHYSDFELVESAEIVKFTGIRSGVRLVQGDATNKAGYQSCDFIDHTHHDWEPCDFTIEPEIFDIDWWDARHNAELDVWYSLLGHITKASQEPSYLYGIDNTIKFYISIDDYYKRHNISSKSVPTIQAKYPIFKVHCQSKALIKFTSEKSGTQLNSSKGHNRPGHKSDTYIHHDDSIWIDCDFTVEPEIFDIDWWDARQEVGLDVWYRIKDISNEVFICSKNPSEYLSLSTGTSCEFYISDPSCQGAVKANQPNQTQKEQPMQHITIQQLLTRLFGAAMPTDYDLRPQYLVVAYNRDGSEMGTATASTIKQVKDKVADTPELWGCRVLTYKLDKEVSVKVPVTASEAKVAEPSDEE